MSTRTYKDTGLYLHCAFYHGLKPHHDDPMAKDNYESLERWHETRAHYTKDQPSIKYVAHTHPNMTPNTSEIAYYEMSINNEIKYFLNERKLPHGHS